MSNAEPSNAEPSTLPDSVIEGPHPEFSSPEADIALVSGDGRTFFTYALVLREASGFFRDTLSLPQPPSTSLATSSNSRIVTTLHLDEDSDTIEALLRCITGKALPALDSPQSIDTIARAAEKYEMPGPMSLVRRTVHPYRLMEVDPMKAYAIACRYGWVEEASVASTKTLSHDIADPAVSSSLEGIDSRQLLRLFHLHRARRDGMRRYMDDATIFNGGSLACGECKAVKDATTWNTLKLRVRTELAENPMGSAISNSEFTKWAECLAVENSKCACGESYYDIHRTCQRLRDGIDRLPKSVDDLETLIALTLGHS